MPGHLSELLVSPKKINFTGYKMSNFYHLGSVWLYEI